MPKNQYHKEQLFIAHACMIWQRKQSQQKKRMKLMREKEREKGKPCGVGKIEGHERGNQHLRGKWEHHSHRSHRQGELNRPISLLLLHHPFSSLFYLLSANKTNLQGKIREFLSFFIWDILSEFCWF